MITNKIVIPTKEEKIGQWELPNGSKPVHPRNVIVFLQDRFVVSYRRLRPEQDTTSPGNPLLFLTISEVDKNSINCGQSQRINSLIDGFHQEVT